MDPAQGLAPPLPHGAPPPLPHRPPPPPPSSYIMGMSTSSSYMSGEGFQSLQSMMKTEAPSYAPMPPSFGLPYHPHPHYQHSNPPPPGPPPPTSYHPSNLPPPTPSYPPPGYNPSYPPPRMPPGHNVPPPVMGLPPAGYPPPPGQPQVPLPPHGMPPVAGMNRGAWMRWEVIKSVLGLGPRSMCLYTIYTVCIGFICILMQVSQEDTDISAAGISAGWIGVSGSSWNTAKFCLGSGFHCSVDFISTDAIWRDSSPQNEKLMYLLSLVLF